ncbi:unnamed protein product [Notodromas monacha]|uniref:Uncharacterized protein n=1 Tax=Notodromas monacha TaxID=399045 RepID=A0A7R9BPV3_9CRUS|nr:unnamed protein product [Notodromas monacha]CAG0919486.1 unnamed protein product [Notodromas monacha]
MRKGASTEDSPTERKTSSNQITDGPPQYKIAFNVGNSVTSPPFWILISAGVAACVGVSFVTDSSFGIYQKGEGHLNIKFIAGSTFLATAIGSLGLSLGYLFGSEPVPQEIVFTTLMIICNVSVIVTHAMADEKNLRDPLISACICTAFLLAQTVFLVVKFRILCVSQIGPASICPRSKQNEDLRGAPSVGNSPKQSSSYTDTTSPGTQFHNSFTGNVDDSLRRRRIQFLNIEKFHKRQSGVPHDATDIAD